MRIDAHQHFWDPARGDYGWLDAAAGPLFRAFGPDELAPLLGEARVARTILVQAAPTEAETHYLLGIARATRFVVGVIGWTDLAAEDAASRVAAIARDPQLVGLRPMLQDLADPEWILRPDLAPALDAMAAAGLVLDALVQPHQLRALSVLAERHPTLAIVLDHGGKPAIGTDLSAWRDELAVLAGHGNVSCKMSGLLTEAAAGADAATLLPVVEHMLRVFGPERLLWGSDWPVVTLVADYLRWVAITDDLLGGLPESDRAAILGGNAARIYRVGQ